MLVSLKKPLAFLYKDFINETSYKFAFVTQIFGIFLSVLSFFFLSKLIGGAAASYLESYGGDYFSFVLVGIALGGYLQVSLRGFATIIRNAQTLGTLEALLVTQTSIPTIILSSTIYSFLLTSFRIVIYLLFGILFLGFNISKANYPGAIIILGLTIICFSSFGVLSASFIMVFKKGNPMNWAFTGVSWLLGGVYYPISVLPEWVQKISFFLPITHSLEGMRQALINGADLTQLAPSIMALILFSVVMIPVSLWAFNYAVIKAKEYGSLIQY